MCYDPSLICFSTIVFLLLSTFESFDNLEKIKFCLHNLMSAINKRVYYHKMIVRHTF